ncbi:MAG: HDIG domain-containing protein [Cyanobacteriota bacterium]|nr:HDIG domain-containing protein [Cyanobacteriota bacterium]
MLRRRLLNLWRRAARLERPRSAPSSWPPGGFAGVLIGCILVGLMASWPWLMEPNLQPGMAAPFTVRAPKDARVMDSEALERRRRDLLPRTTVQVVDRQASLAIQQQLEGHLRRLEQLAQGAAQSVEPIPLAPKEMRWLQGLSPEQLARWERDVRQAQLRMLSQGLSGGVAEGQLLEAANLQLEGQQPVARSLGARLIGDSLLGQTNLRSDPSLTQRRIEELITQQGIPTLKVSKGELIVGQGEPISQQAFDVLDYFGLVSRRPRPIPWAGHLLEGMAAAGILVLLQRRWKPCLESRQAMLSLAILLAVQAARLWLGPLASPPVLLVPPTLLLAQGLGTACGLAWLAAASLLWAEPISTLMAERLLLGALVAAMAALLAGRQRSRVELLQLVVVLPTGTLLLQWLLLQSPLMARAGQPAQIDLVSESLLMGSLLLAGLLLAPLVESFFDLLTRARLLELADLERPLLRRLSCEAPGTFEHTLMITGLAEEGARAIGADVDLVRTGALYHDVGKLHGPQWFIENQGDGTNPHDTLNDPFASAAILQAHVDEGLKLARRHRLPRSLADFIPEHQGTLKMGYFLHQARERQPGVEEARFRYRGPNPRSRETAILMLADGCEAALRSLPPGTSDTEAQKMVRRLVEARALDGQLSSSGMGPAERELVIRAFVRVWKRMRHRRIPYPINPRKGFSA